MNFYNLRAVRRIKAQMADNIRIAMAHLPLISVKPRPKAEIDALIERIRTANAPLKEELAETEATFIEGNLQ